MTSLDLVQGNNDEFNLPNHVINVMRESSDECLWLVRLHPSFVLSHLDSLVKFFDNCSINNIEIINTSSISLFDVIDNADYFLTRGSSPIFDALQYDLSAAVTDYKGFKQYENLFNQGYISYVNNEDSLRNFLNTDERLIDKNLLKKYIYTENLNINNTIDSIMYS